MKRRRVQSADSKSPLLFFAVLGVGLASSAAALFSVAAFASAATLTAVPHAVAHVATYGSIALAPAIVLGVCAGLTLGQHLTSLVARGLQVESAEFRVSVWSGTATTLALTALLLHVNPGRAWVCVPAGLLAVASTMLLLKLARRRYDAWQVPAHEGQRATRQQRASEWERASPSDARPVATKPSWRPSCPVTPCHGRPPAGDASDA